VRRRGHCLLSVDAGVGLEFEMTKRVFTPAAIETIRELAAQKKPAAEIADVIGSTPGSVRVKCCLLKIQLRRSGQLSLGPSWPAHFGEKKLVLCLRPATYTAFKRKAADMQKPTDELAGRLLAEIIKSNIYEAVLDDAE
jgi:hypothetical protein